MSGEMRIGVWNKYVFVCFMFVIIVFNLIVHKTKVYTVLVNSTQKHVTVACSGLSTSSTTSSITTVSQQQKGAKLIRIKTAFGREGVPGNSAKIFLNKCHKTVEITI